jgi:hypothetical protein
MLDEARDILPGVTEGEVAAELRAYAAHVKVKLYAARAERPFLSKPGLD